MTAPLFSFTQNEYPHKIFNMYTHLIFAMKKTIGARSFSII